MGLTIVNRPFSLRLAGGLTLAVAVHPMVLALERDGQQLQLPIRRTTLALQSGPSLVVRPQKLCLSISVRGMQGPTGPQQFYVGGDAPSAIAVPILWFKPCDAPNATADDYEMELIEGAP